MRRTLMGLGMREIPRPEGAIGERGLHEVCKELGTWLKGVSNGEQEPPLSLFVYCTGHGERKNDSTWGLALPTYDAWAKGGGLLDPGDIIDTLYGGDRQRKKELFEQAVVVLDACYSEPGAGEAMETRRRQAAVGSVKYDVWVIATARKAQQAQQLAFARAFAKTLSQSDGTQEFIEPSTLVERLNSYLPTDSQEVWVSSVDRRSCRALPDPAYMPRTSPDWLDRDLDEWSHLARGRSRPGQEGWYFSGRHEEQLRLREFIAGGGPAGPLILRGAAGVGKSALLGHLAVCGKTEWRRLLPPVARRGLILPDDSVHALVTAQDAGVSSLSRRIARALGLDHLGNAPTPDELCEALEGLPPRTVLLDDLHLADETAAVVTELLDPLAEYARTTVIASAGHDADADAVWQRLQLPVFQIGTDDEGVHAYARARGAGAVAAACHGHFGAAVHAVDALLDTRHDRDGGAEARHEAEKQLTIFHRSLLASRRRPDDWCRAILEPVRAAAACGYDAGLTAELWAALATAADRSGRTYGPEEAREAAELLGAAVTDRGTGEGTGSSAGPPAWRLATPAALKSCRPEFAEAVRDCLPVHASGAETEGAPAAEESGIDWAADMALTALFAAAARPFEQRFATELTSMAFWAALPGSALARQLDAGGDRLFPERVVKGVRAQTPGRHPAERAFQLKLSLLRSGEGGRGLDPRGFGAGVDVLWATTPQDGVAVPDLLAVASGASGDGYVVTTHGDASLRLWNLANGRPLDEAVRSEDAGIASHLALAVVDGKPVVAFVADGVGHLWRPLTGRDPERLATLDGATAFSLHGDGLLAVARGTRIEIVEPGATGRTRSFAVLGSSRVTQVHLGGEAGDRRLVATTEFGTVTARVLDTGVTALRRQPLLIPYAQHAVVSSSGRTVGMLDRSGGPFVWDESHGTRSLDIPAVRDGTLAFAVGDSLAAAAGGAQKPWLCLLPITSGDERPVSRFPLPDQPVALALDADGSRLVVTDLRGVFCLDVRPDPPRPDTADSDPPGPSPTTDRSEEAR
ncbi:ATP-binding protein [Streptomyces sp. PanSC19]|uniref:ATP-binding protein n=1 Tax=Streptomyces sp. PanSC19 TaxID=1520455 RepID=UPI000F4903A4|nr:ATP-binding protein [Streptomyces sp. PanSC19]